MEEEEEVGTILVIHRFDNFFKNRKGIFQAFNSDGSVKEIDLPGPPDYSIICDGCNDMIIQDHVNALSFVEDAVHSIQCDKCVKKYFSKCPKKNLLDPSALLNKALYYLKDMDILKNTPSTFDRLKKTVEKSIKQFIEEIKREV